MGPSHTGPFPDRNLCWFWRLLSFFLTVGKLCEDRHCISYFSLPLHPTPGSFINNTEHLLITSGGQGLVSGSKDVRVGTISLYPWSTFKFTHSFHIHHLTVTHVPQQDIIMKPALPPLWGEILQESGIGKLGGSCKMDQTESI